MSNYKISVIIPIYNVEEYLEECLDSILDQTLDDIEVIMIDDDSPDGCPAIAKRYAEKHDNFHYIWQENGGQGNARNNGVKYAHGEYLTFVDPDDVIPKYAYEKMYRVAHDRDKDIVTGNVIRFNSQGEFTSQLHIPAFKKYCVDTNIYENNNLLYDTTSTNKLIRREFWDKENISYPEGMLYEDIPITFIMYCSTMNVGMIHDICYKWRVREGESKSVTQNRNESKNFNDRMKAISMMDNFFAEKVFDKQLIEAKNFRWVYTDFMIFLKQCLAMTEENSIKIMKSIKEYVEKNIHEDTICKLPELYQQIYFALENEEYERVLELRKFVSDGLYKTIKTSHDGNRILGWFPHKIILDTPLDIGNHIKMQSLQQRITGVEFKDYKCTINGYAVLRNVPANESLHQEIKAFIFKEETDERYEVSAIAVKSDAAQKRFGIATDKKTVLNDYRFSGYEIVIDLKKDIVDNGLCGDYTILIDYYNHGFEKQAELAGGSKALKSKIDSIYGSYGDSFVSFSYELGSVLNMNISHDSKYQPELAMHSLFTRLKKTGSRFTASGICLHRFKDEKGKELAPEKVNVLIGNNEKCGKLAFSNSKGISLSKGIKLNRYTISFDEADLVNLDIQNKVQLKYGNVIARIGYNIFDRSKGRYKTSRIFNCGDLACYLKQSVYNGMYLTVREPQIYDEPAGRFRSLIAWIAANFWFKNGIIFMYEKECSRYQESASVLYEKLIDEGYTNVYFVVNEDSPEIHNLEEKYRKNLIYKDSFKHLLYFFKSKVFISSETMSHAMQLRASDKRIARKTDSKDISYVFLQHGVMYMVSLNADLRVSFRQKGLNLYRVVVSSELEAKHFIDFAGFEKEELYVTGLATFDKSVRYEDADRIVIMPTWRRWENSQARQEFTKTGYYQMIKRMVDAVPENLREKIVILPHPLMQQAMNNSENELSRYMATETHDNTLKYCDLLITDYSSIAYDAYYRGCNVIFYWEEKEACMKQYGPETTLMLTVEKAFGDICYNAVELSESIQRWYGKKQNEEYNRKYRDIVTYHDNRNSERIIDLLKQDGVL